MGRVVGLAANGILMPIVASGSTWACATLARQRQDEANKVFVSRIMVLVPL